MSNSKSLIILGNGADLYCKLNTTFKDFLTRENEENILNVYKSLKALKTLDLNLKNIVLNSPFQINNHEFLQKTYRFPIYQLLNKKITIDLLLNEEFSKYNHLDTKCKKVMDMIKQEVEDVTLLLSKTMKSITELSFWEILLILMDQINGTWYDIETCMNNFLTMKSIMSNPDKSAIEYIHDSIRDLRSEEFFSIYEIDNYSPLNDFNFRFIIYVIIYKIIKNNDNKKSYLTTFQYQSFLLNELHKFENKFSNFVASEVHKSDNTIKPYYQRLNTLVPILISLSNNNKANILSFNYTHVQTNNNYIDKYKNIHGSLLLEKENKINKSNVIFGIDSNTIYPKQLNQFSIDLIYPFTKTQRVLGLSTNTKEDIENRIANLQSVNKIESKYINVIDDTINEIVFFGHSLGESDYSYFMSIFDHYKLNDSKITLKFVFNPKRNKKDPCPEEVRNIRLGQAKRISSLINRYSNTLENKNHGKNLLHKLLVEDRIQIVDIRDINTRKMWDKLKQKNINNSHKTNS